jgi:beta-galactosidase
MLECYKLEYEAVKKYTPNLPVTTNLMGFYKPLDYQKWAKYMDVVAWDNYPSNQQTPSEIAICHELMRGVGEGKPFLLMEQTPSVTNWAAYNALKRPGVMRLWSYQAVARGADSVMFFQMRRSIGACEKYHGAIIDHVGNENTRVFREAAALGEELDRLGDAFMGSRIEAKIAILFDWDNWWAIEYSAGPSCLLKYRDEVQRYYDALFAQNIPVDIIGCDSDFSKYEVIFAPILYMVKPGVDEKIRSFVKNGGSFVTTFFSGYVEDHDLVVTGGYPGKLRDILGIWVEESDALPEGDTNHFTWEGDRHEITLLCDLLHSEGAEVLTTYEEDFYAGMPVLTRNHFGNGDAYYVAVRSDAKFYAKLVEKVCSSHKIYPVLATPDGVEVTMRKNENEQFIFLLNHNKEPKCVILHERGTDLLTGTTYEVGTDLTLDGYGVAIIKQS